MASIRSTDDANASHVSRINGRIVVGDRFFSKPNVTLPRGGVLRWIFNSRELHNVTVANGPRGFSSPNLDGRRAYKTRLRVPGTYKLFCGLHPVSMTQTIKVVGKKKSGRRR